MLWEDFEYDIKWLGLVLSEENKLILTHSNTLYIITINTSIACSDRGLTLH